MKNFVKNITLILIGILYCFNAFAVTLKLINGSKGYRGSATISYTLPIRSSINVDIEPRSDSTFDAPDSANQFFIDAFLISKDRTSARCFFNGNIKPQSFKISMGRRDCLIELIA